MSARVGATARMMLIQAAANDWKVPVAECSAATASSRIAPSGRTTTYGKVSRPPRNCRAGGRQAEGSEGLEAGRQGTEAARHTLIRSPARWVYGIDVKLPGMLNAAIKDCPRHRRHAEEL